MLSLLSKLMKNFVNEVKFLIKFFYVEYILFVLRYYLSTTCGDCVKVASKRRAKTHAFFVAPCACVALKFR